jgi:DNA-binding transcriptional MerR regulator
MKQYSVKQLAKLAGVSVRTLHLYDQKGLLAPAVRTESRYRYYGEKELLQLQQILFYREIDFSLHDIKNIISDPEFDVVTALEHHKIALSARQSRISTLLTTIDKTIHHLKNGENMLKDEELYEGLPKDKAEAYRREAIAKWGQDTVEKSESQLRNMSKMALDDLKSRFLDVGKQLFALRKEEPTSPRIQDLIALHFACICAFWGKKPTAEAYIGLGRLYTQDERYSMHQEAPQPDYAAFLSAAMLCFAERTL